MQTRRNYNMRCASENSEIETFCDTSAIVYKALDIITATQQSD